MPKYVIGITPLLGEITEPSSNVTQAGFANDHAGARKLERLLTWWNNIVEYGPSVGYRPQADMSWLVDEEHLLQEANRALAGDNIKITADGR